MLSTCKLIAMLHTSRALAFVTFRTPLPRAGAAVIAKQFSGQRQQLQLLSRRFATNPSNSRLDGNGDRGSGGKVINDSPAGSSNSRSGGSYDPTFDEHQLVPKDVRANTSGGGGRGGRASRGTKAGGGYVPPKPNLRPPVVTRGTLSNTGAPPPTSSQARLLSTRAAAAAAGDPPPSARSLASPRKIRSISSTAKATSVPAAGNSAELPSYVTNELFADAEGVAPHMKRALADVLKLKQMTEIQVKALPLALSGKDLLARARTGTGKTVAFLVPAMQAIHPERASVDVLVISPTRELATQIAKQASALATFDNGCAVQVCYGGTNANTDKSRFSRDPPSVLVSTPGRLLDHLENTKLTNGKSFRQLCSKLQVLVLDEADQLMDQGFSRDIQRIVSYLPPKRQTVLFSATMPPALKTVMASVMTKDYGVVDCINDGDAATATNAQVAQAHVMLPSLEAFVEGTLKVLLACIEESEARGEEPKIIVFFATAYMTSYMAQVANAVGIPTLEMHSRKSQAQRDKASDAFRRVNNGGAKKTDTSRVLFTSNVSARGVDYPVVSHVIQVGIPDSREQYIHRLGRTGRGGQAGRGILVLAPHEKPFLKELGDLAVPEDAKLVQILAAGDQSDEEPLQKLPALLKQIGDASAKNKGDSKLDSSPQGVLAKSAEASYRAWLGFYNGQKRRTTDSKSEKVVERANQFGTVMGLRSPPPLEKNTIGKMGLKGVQGLNIKASSRGR